MKPLSKLVLTVFVVSVAIWSSLLLTPPLYALDCAPRVGPLSKGCFFIGEQAVDGYYCCMYQCTNGALIAGYCVLI